MNISIRNIFLFACFFVLANAKAQRFNAVSGIPVDLDVGTTSYSSCTVTGDKSNIQFNVSGVGTLSPTKALASIEISFDASCGDNLRDIALYIKSPSGVCLRIYNGANATNIATGIVNVVLRDGGCLGEPNFASGWNTAKGSTGNYGVFRANSTTDMSTAFNGANADGTWTIYAYELTSFAPCITSASIVFGDPTTPDKTNAGETCGNPIVWNGESFCASTNAKAGSTQMPGSILGPNTNSFGTLNGVACAWNNANNNDVWISITPKNTGQLCISLSNLGVSQQSIIVKDANPDGDGQACSQVAKTNCFAPCVSNDPNWDVVSCPRNSIYTTTAGGAANQQHCFSAVKDQTYYLVVDGNGGAETPFYVSGLCSTPNLVVNNPPAVCSPSTVNLTLAAVTAGSYLNGVTLTYWTNAAATTPLANPTAVATSGIYYIKASTSSDCPSVTLPVTVTVNQPPLAPSVTSPITYCYGATASALTASGTNLLWYTTAAGGTGSATAPTPSTSAPGSTVYYVSQTVNGCEGPRAAITVTVYEPIAIYAHGTNPSCSSVCNGDATVDVTGGAAPYTYSWSNGATTKTITGLCAGTYTVTVKDANNCTSSLTPVTYNCPQIQSILVDACYFDPSLEGYEEMVFFQNGNTSLAVSNASFNATWPSNTWLTLCTPNASYIAAANATIPAGSGGSLIAVSPGGTIPANANVVLITSNTLTSPNMSFSNLKGPLYVITQCAGNTQGHFANGNASPAGPRTTTINFNASCSETVTYSTGSLIDINGSTGGTSATRNGAYVNFSSSGTPSYLNYGCTIPYTTQSSQVVLTVPSSLTATVSTTNVTCNGTSANGTITVTTTGGTAPLQYSIDGGVTFQSSNVFSGLAAGTYQIRVRDVNNCVFNTSAVITATGSLVLSTTQINTTCTGLSNGSVDLTVSGGTPTQVLTNLSTITQDFNTLVNSGTSSTMPSSPGVAWSFLEIGGNTTYTAGTGSLNTGDTYSFGSSLSSDRAIGGLRSGSNNPILGASFTNTTGQTVTQLTITYTGEQWRLGDLDRTDKLFFQYSTSATGLNTGTWVSVSALDFTAPVQSGSIGQLDGNLSTNRTTMTSLITGLNIPPGATFWIRWTDYDATGTTGADDGLGIDDFSLIMSGPVPTSSYTYLWSNGATTEDISGLSAGTYTVTVTDAAGCTGTKTVTITQPSAVVASNVVTNVTCNGQANGSAVITASGGTPGYNVKWGGTATGDPAGTEIATSGGSYTITPLNTGSYTVTVTDANSCTATASVTISQPTVLNISNVSTNITCNGLANGSVQVTASGGTAGYNVKWGGTATGDPAGTEIAASGGNYVITPLAAGTYTITVTDANLCTASANATISQPNALSVSNVPTNVTCVGLTNGSAVITATGGTAGYNVSWTGTTTGDPAGTEIAASGGQYTLNTLGAGTYNVTVTDANNCTATTTVTVGGPTPVTPTFTIASTLCNGASAPVLPTTSSNGITGTWNPSTVSNTINGNYLFTPTNGLCASTFNLSVTVNPCKFGEFGSAVYINTCVNGTSGSSFYNTTGTGANIINQTGPNFLGSNLGTYVQNSGNLKLDGGEIKTFKDAGTNVCVPVMYYTIYSGTRPANPSFTAVTLNFYQNCSGTSFTSGGPCSGNDQKWQVPGSGSSLNFDLTNRVPGTYTIEVYYQVNGDVNNTSGCGDVLYVNNNNSPTNYSSTFTIVAPTSISYAPITLCSNSTSSPPTVTGITGGTYSSSPAGLSINTTTGVINPSLSTPGTYTVTYNYKDANGCPLAIQTNVTVNPLPTPITLTGSQICAPTSVGSITSTSSATGVNYQLYNSSGQAVGTPLAGGAALTWSNVPVGTGYYAVGTNPLTACSSANSNSVNVIQNQPPKLSEILKP